MTHDEMGVLEELLKLMRQYGVSRIHLSDSEPGGDSVEIEMREDSPSFNPRPGDPMTEDLQALEAQRRQQGVATEPMDEPCGCSPSPQDPHLKEIHHTLGGCLFGCDVAKCAQPIHQGKS